MDFPSTNGNRIRNFAVNPELKDCSFNEDSSKDAKGSSSHGTLVLRSSATGNRARSMSI
jgi:hypothetical protein